MTFADAISWLNTYVFTPVFNFSLSFAGGVTFGSIVVAIFGLPLIVKAWKRFF